MSSFFMPFELLCSALEAIINKAIMLNVSTTSLQPLHEKTLSITLDECPKPIVFVFNDKTVSVLSGEQANDCDIKTSLATLYKIKQKESLTALIRQQELDVVGDMKIAQIFANYAETLEIDWQSELAEHIGDIATHKLVTLADSIKAKILFAQQQVTLDSQEWLLHEKKWLVTKPEFFSFSTNVTTVSDKLHQLEQRLQQLINHHSIHIKQP